MTVRGISTTQSSRHRHVSTARRGAHSSTSDSNSTNSSRVHTTHRRHIADSGPEYTARCTMSQTQHTNTGGTQQSTGGNSIDTYCTGIHAHRERHTHTHTHTHTHNAKSRQRRRTVQRDEEHRGESIASRSQTFAYKTNELTQRKESPTKREERNERPTLRNTEQSVRVQCREPHVESWETQDERASECANERVRVRANARERMRERANTRASGRDGVCSPRRDGSEQQ
jgi:hypothetical protein